jgi:hypothetical protein
VCTSITLPVYKKLQAIRILGTASCPSTVCLGFKKKYLLMHINTLS